MSGSAKKRREKARLRLRRARGEARWQAERERTNAAGHEAFMAMCSQISDRIPGHHVEIVFAEEKGS